MTSRNPDRTIHGITRDRYEVVRYDRAGKWYIEGGAAKARQHVSMMVAAKLTAHGGTHFPGLSGGQSFDRAVVNLTAGRWR